MNQEVIQDFLNLPGIAGVALMDGRARPYFCGVDQTLNFQQKEALAQGILQVVETMPDGFESFEFQFTRYQVHIYKLEQGIVLLVLTHDELVYSDYLKTIKDLKATLQEDIGNAIATFRLIAGSTTFSGMNYRKSSSDSTPSNLSTHPDLDTPPLLPLPPEQPSQSYVAKEPIPPQHSEDKAPPAAPANTPTLKDLIAALNHLSDFTTQYLGTHVISNYWKASRPNHYWLEKFQVDRSARFSLIGSASQNLQAPLTSEECQWVREWVAAFIKRCSLVIRDFPAIVHQKALTPNQKFLLLG